MKCPQCGFENFDHARTCLGCGLQLEAPLAPPLPVEEADGGISLPPPQLDAGKIIVDSIEIYFRNILSFIFITIVSFLPVSLLVALLIAVSSTNQDMLAIGIFGLALIVVASMYLTMAAMTHAVLQHLQRGAVSATMALKAAFPVVITVFAAAVLQGLAMAAGFILLIVPAFIVMSMLAVAIPAIVQERIGAVDALRRSAALTKGYRWKVFNVFFLIGLLNFALSAAFNKVLIPNAPTVGMIISTASDFALGGIQATAIALIYYRLRAIKEGVDIDGLASVFD